MQSHTNITITSETIFKTIFIGLLFWLLFVLRDLVLVVLAAVVIASAIEPFTRWFIKYRIPRVLSVIIIYVLLIAFFFCIFYFFLPPLLNDISGAWLLFSIIFEVSFLRRLLPLE